MLRRVEELEEEARQLRGELPPGKATAPATSPATPQITIGEFFDPHEGEGPVFTNLSSSLRQCFPAINTDHFRDIWKNKFKAVNIVKLGTDFGSLTEGKKFWNVVDRGIQLVDDDGVPGDIKGINHLMK